MMNDLRHKGTELLALCIYRETVAAINVRVIIVGADALHVTKS